MECDLVEDSVIVAEVEEAFQVTEEYEEFISEFDQWTEPGIPHLKLSLTDFPVALNSIRGSKEERNFFAGKLNQILKEKDQRFGDVKLELILIHGTQDFVDKYGFKGRLSRGYVLLSGMEESPDSEEKTVNILARLEDAFGENEVHFDIELSLVHMLTKDAHPSLDSVITLKASNLKYCSLPHRVGGLVSPTPLAMNDMWWEKSGFIRGKLSVKVKVDEDAANYFLKFRNCCGPENLEDLNRKLLMEDGIFKDLEIGCKNGAVVKCHAAFLAASSKKLGNEWKAQRERPLVLEMKMEEEGVKGFLEWVYCKQVSKAAGEKCEGALELLKAAGEYEVSDLETELEKLILSKNAKDFKYFSVDGALNLYLNVKDECGFRELESLAVRVLKNYIKSAGDKLNESVGYQNLFRNDPQEALKLSHLYGRLS